jgi:hypothetical protein
VPPRGVLNAQGALLKSERCVTEYIFEVLLSLVGENTYTKPTVNERKQTATDR